MTADIRLLVLDIDGTIAGHSNQITKRVLDRIREVQAKGIQVAIATGRMYRSALRFHAQVGSTLPLMAYQGAFIKDPRTQRLLRHSPLPRNLAMEILTYLAPLESQEALSIHLYIDDVLHVRAVVEDTIAYAERSGVEPLAAGDLYQLLQQNSDLDTTKLLALSADIALIADLISKLGQQYSAEEIYLTRSVDTFFEATHPLANKGAAVKYLAEELLDLRPDQVMTVGDNFNDLEMIQYAGIGVAMGDAPLPVQEAADWVAPSVEVDGVAQAIEHFLL